MSVCKYREQLASLATTRCQRCVGHVPSVCFSTLSVDYAFACIVFQLVVCLRCLEASLCVHKAFVICLSYAACHSKFRQLIRIVQERYKCRVVLKPLLAREDNTEMCLETFTRPYPHLQ